MHNNKPNIMYFFTYFYDAKFWNLMQVWVKVYGSTIK